MNLRTLSVLDVMERTGFTRDRVYRLVHAQELAFIRATKRGYIRILESSLQAYFERATQGGVVGSTDSPDRPSRRADDVDAAILPDGPRLFS